MNRFISKIDGNTIENITNVKQEDDKFRNYPKTKIPRKFLYLHDEILEIFHNEIIELIRDCNSRIGAN